MGLNNGKWVTEWDSETFDCCHFPFVCGCLLSPILLWIALLQPNGIFPQHRGHRGHGK